MISSIRIKNLRSLRDTGDIELRPLTILIGGNSSGKSTFLRTFPLLSQTVSHNLRTAIAWYDESSVDFGDFSTSKTRNIEDDYIKFSFGIDFSNLLGLPHDKPRYSNNSWQTTAVWTLSIYYKQRADNKGVYVNCIEINLNGNTIKFFYRDKETIDIIFNEHWIKDLNLYYSKYNPNGLFPEILPFSPNSKEIGYDAVLDVMSPLKKYCSNRFNNLARLRTIWNLWNESPIKFISALKKYSDIKSLSKEFQTWNVDNPKFLNLYSSIYVLRILYGLRRINRSLKLYFNNCDYVAPLRAEASRYIRYKGLQVNKVDAYGRNLSEFIDSLTGPQRDSLNDFIENALGVKIKVRNNNGHQSINLIRDGEETNMADVGFGYSQILPIITKLWQMQERSRFNSMAFYRSPIAIGLIEQPELHLHPALQAKLADVFVKTALNKEAKTNLIIETHSPTIINRIGRRIREGYITPDMVNIVIFNKDSVTGYSNVFSTEFMSDGRIKDWPTGFFEPETDTF